MKKTVLVQGLHQALVKPQQFIWPNVTTMFMARHAEWKR